MANSGGLTERETMAEAMRGGPSNLTTDLGKDTDKLPHAATFSTLQGT